MNKIKVLIFALILVVVFIFIISYQTWKQNASSCSCSKNATTEGMSGMEQELQDVLSHVTAIINVLNNMSDELNKLRDWLVVHNDTLDKKTVQFGMVNISGNLANMSLQLSELSSKANTYSGVMENVMYRQAVSKIANDLGNQSIVVQNASNDLMVWSDWLEQNNRLNELPGNIARIETTLRELSIYLTILTNQLNIFYKK